MFIMSKPAFLCADDLTSAMRWAWPLSISECGWNVYVVLSVMLGKISFSVQEVSLFYIEDQCSLSCQF